MKAAAVEAEYTDRDWFGDGLEDMAKHKLWYLTRDLRPNMPLELRRTRNVPKSGKDTYSTELCCCKVVLPLAPLKNEAHAQFLLDGWFKVLDPILSAYEIKPSALNPPSITDADSFIRGIMGSKEYKEKHQE